MKKIILTVALALGCLTVANAQQNALGLKFGGWNNNADISYQRFLNESNRLEANLGVVSFDALDIFSINAKYQWVFDLDQLAPGFKWYVGAGAGTVLGSGIDFNLALFGNIGIEYNFSFPLQLAFDYTPSMMITPNFGNTYFGDAGIRFAARWRF